MSTYHPHLNRRDRRAPRAAAIWTTPAENETERRERIAAERETRRRLDADRETRAAARREQRASDASRTHTRSNLEAKAGTLFPWDLMVPDRKIAAVLTGQQPGSLYPIPGLARLFAGVNLGVSPGELGVAGQAANFMPLAAPRTRSWPEITRVADFFIEATAFEGRAFDRSELMEKARRALTYLEDRLSTLPDWLTVHELRKPWFIIRPTPKTAKAMWAAVLASKAAASP
jgi:hypothetical protein